MKDYTLETILQSTKDRQTHEVGKGKHTYEAPL